MTKAQAEQAVDTWFAARGWKVFPFQRAVWKAALAGESGLLHANTGAGKTYAVWFAAMLRGARSGKCGTRRANTGLRVLWITPMRALAADTQRSLEVSAAELGAASPDVIGMWSVGARTGDDGLDFNAARQDSLKNLRQRRVISLGEKPAVDAIGDHIVGTRSETGDRGATGRHVID